MAADGEVLRSFLVSLGFKVDDIQQRKFENFAVKAEKSVVSLAKASVGAGTAAAAMVTNFANQFERLYYLAQRSNSSVLSLQAAGSGAERIGVGAQKMQSAIEGIARNIRMNPGVEAVINGLGVKVQGRDTADVALDVAKQLSKMPFYQAAQYGNLFGIDADTLFMLQQGLDKYEAAYKARKQLAQDLGIDTEKAAQAAVEYKNEWRDITDLVSVLGEALSIKLLGPAKDLAGATKEILKDWIGIIRRTDSFGQFVDKLWQGFTRQETKPGVVLTPEAQARALKLSPFVSITPQKGGGRIVNEGEDIHEFRTGGTGPLPKAGTTQPTGSPGPRTKGERNNNPGNIEYGDFAVRMGATGSDGRFAIFPSAEFGLRAQAELLSTYARNGFNSVRSIVGRWSNPKEDPTGNRNYVANVSQALGVSPTERLEQGDPKVMATLMQAMIRQELGKVPYTQQQIQSAAEKSSIVVNQKTEINVHGAQDPLSTGKVVMDGQDRVNGTLSRQLRGSTR